MATINAINYLKHKEDQRSHLAQEAETNRANVAKERETNRSNLANERLGRDTLAETHRSNVAREVETNRSNVAKEGETKRHNLVTEGIDAKVGNSNIYKNQQQGNLYNAQTARYDMENAEIAALGQTGYGYDVLNKEQQVYKTLAETYAKEQEGNLKANQAATEGSKATANVVTSAGSLFRGLSGLFK